MGSGSKFKTDFLNYLQAYDSKRTICKPLIEQLTKYDFSKIRAALVGSVPGRQDMESDSQTFWGWAGLKNVLKSVPVSDLEPDIVIQISSIATLGQNNKWLDKTLFDVLKTSKNLKSNPKFHVIFPTADEIRRSLNGYASGSAIRMIPSTFVVLDVVMACDSEILTIHYFFGSVSLTFTESRHQNSNCCTG